MLVPLHDSISASSRKVLENGVVKKINMVFEEVVLHFKKIVRFY